MAGGLCRSLWRPVVPWGILTGYPVSLGVVFVVLAPRPYTVGQGVSRGGRGGSEHAGPYPGPCWGNLIRVGRMASELEPWVEQQVWVKAPELGWQIRLEVGTLELGVRRSESAMLAHIG